MSRSLSAFVTFAIAALAVFYPGAKAQAYGGDYCREYTRTVYIGGRVQDAYGTACLQPDGSWMIVGEGLGNDIPDSVNNVNYIIHDNRRDIVPTRVVYYERAPRYYRSRPAPIFVWYNDGRHYRNGHYVHYHNVKYKKRHKDRDWDHGWRDRDDHHHGRGRGRGHDHDRWDD